MDPSRARVQLSPIVLVLACQPAVPQASTTMGSSSGPVLDDTGTIVSSGASDGASDDVPADDGVGDTPPDLGARLPEPPGPSRLVLDVATARGHVLELHELIDGEPQPPVQLVPESAATVSFVLAPLGPADRLVLTARYGNGSHELLLVDWSEGQPATVTSLASGYSSSATAWVPSLDALVVRSDQDFLRVELGVGAPEPVPLLSDVPFGVVFDTGPIPLMTVTPLLAVPGTATNEDLYVADVADPSRPTQRVTDFAETSNYLGDIRQLTDGHLVFEVRNRIDAPSELHVLLRVGDDWGATLRVPSPIEPPDSVFAPRPGPLPDEFVYLAMVPDDPELAAIELGGVLDGTLAPAQTVHHRLPAQIELSADGQRVVLSGGVANLIEVIDVVDGEPTPARAVAGPDDTGGAAMRITELTPDGAWAFVRLTEPDGLYGTRGLARVGLAPEAGLELVFGGAGSTVDIRNDVVAPDGRSLAFTHSSPAGYVTELVDCSGDAVGPLVAVDQGDAPIIDTLRPSPDSAWLAIDGSSGGPTDSVSVVLRDDPGTAVLQLHGLRGPSLWLP